MAGAATRAAAKTPGTVRPRPGSATDQPQRPPSTVADRVHTEEVMGRSTVYRRPPSSYRRDTHTGRSAARHRTALRCRIEPFLDQGGAASGAGPTPAAASGLGGPGRRASAPPPQLP